MQVAWAGDGAYGFSVVDAEAGSLEAWGMSCGILQHVAGSVQFRIKYGHVAGEGEEMETNDGAYWMDGGGQGWLPLFLRTLSRQRRGGRRYLRGMGKTSFGLQCHGSADIRFV